MLGAKRHQELTFFFSAWKKINNPKEKEWYRINDEPVCENNELTVLHRFCRICIKGKEYNSTNAASKAGEGCRSTITRKLQDPSNNDYKYLNTPQIKAKSYKNISVHGEVYLSIRDIVNSGLAKNATQVIRNINNPNKPEWFIIKEDQ